MSVQSIRLVPFDEQYLDRSWVWLNDPEIKAMTMTPDFTRDEQKAFFESLPKRSDYRIWGVETLDGEPIGAGGLKHVAGVQAEVWCYIGDRNAWGRGLGRQIITACEECALAEGITTLIAHVAMSNERSLAAFRKSGYRPDREEPDAGFSRLTKVLG